MTDDEWMREHKGPLREVIGYVWSCGDDWCGCTQAQVLERYANLKAPGFVVPIAAWEGTFYTSDEGGAEDELITYRDSLSPERRARITWIGIAP